MEGTRTMTTKRKTSEKPQPSAAPTPGGRRKKGLEKVLVRLEPRQAQALRAEAFRRAQERGKGQPDASEVLREALDEWLRRRQ